MERYWKLVAVGLGTFAVLIVWFLWPTDPFGPRGFNRIRLGMTEQEVEKAIGAPAGDYHTYRTFGGITSPGRHGSEIARFGLASDLFPRPYGTPGRIPDGRMVTVKQWWGNYYWLNVAFDEEGLVVRGYLVRINW